MKRMIWLGLLLCFIGISCGFKMTSQGIKNSANKDRAVHRKLVLGERNLIRSMQLADKALSVYFSGEDLKMHRFYNPYSGNKSEELGSVWMYTSAIETVNSILSALKTIKEEGKPEFYNKYFSHYLELLEKLFDNASYYKGTFTHTSFTQTKEWTVYGVDRSPKKNSADVEGIKNVYDDQEWLIKELLRAYQLTGKKKYLKEGEYLTQYVLDGWDCTLDDKGKEFGGISWGPGYVTKHACSNGPLISSLVKLSGIYKHKSDRIIHRYVEIGGERKEKKELKRNYYLNFAMKVYQWQKDNLLRPDGVYDDMLGGCGQCRVSYKKVDGTKYRKHVSLSDRIGPAYSYNSGAMLSGAADLFQATQDSSYWEDMVNLTNASFRKFAKLDASVSGYYTYEVKGFDNWFNEVLLSGYLDVYPLYNGSHKSIRSFQMNLDYGYEKFLYKGMLPNDLLLGWQRKPSEREMEGMFAFAFATEYARLAQFVLNYKDKKVVNRK